MMAGAGFDSLDALLRPASVAVVGASEDPTRIGGRPIAFMLARAFPGRLLPVNPKRATIQGLAAFPDIAALPETPDVAIIAIPVAAALEAVDALGARGCRAAIVFTAGFAETGREGAADQVRLAAIARGHGMRLLGPNCLGLFNAPAGFYGTFTASFEKGWPIPGPIGIASQSGAYGTHVFAAALDRGLGTSVCVTTGNEADVDLGDAIGWMAAAAEVEVICAYAEGVRDGPRFVAALAAARAAGKPVVIMKVGRSALGGAAAASHTASVAGDDRVFDAVLETHGAIRARTTEALLDIAYAAARGVFPARNTLGVLTISGGAGVLIADAAEAERIPMPPMPGPAQARLRDLVPFCAPANPVDCTAQVTNQPELIAPFLQAVAEGGYSAILAFWSQVAAGRSLGPRIAAEMAAARAAFPDRLWVASNLAPDRVRDYEAAGILVFEDPSRAVAAIAAMGRFGAAFAAPPAAAAALPAVTLPDTNPDEAAAKRLLADAGIAPVPERVATDAETAVAAARELGFPVVLKILSPDIAHKTEIGGVLLGVADPDAVRAGVAVLRERAASRAPGARITGILVAAQITEAVELAMGVLRDPVFGPIAMVGLGGVFIEVLGDVALRPCPVDSATAEAMIRSLRGLPLLEGARGRPPTDIAAAARALAALSAFAVAAGPRLAAIDVNPLLVLPAGQGCLAADAVIHLSAPGAAHADRS